MSELEFVGVRRALVSSYAFDQHAAGLGDLTTLTERARSQIDDLLPEGLLTLGMQLLTAESDTGAVVGHIWFGLERAASAPGTAWLYDIEINVPARNKGYGRALREAAEAAARSLGAVALGLNVLATNPIALHLYETSGYVVTAQQMQKSF